jgi:disulfide bond formation protein DsbB
MSDPPKILDPPTPPPRRFVTAILNLIALILLLIGETRFGIIAVALALASSVFDIFASRSGGPGASTQGPQGPTAGTR